MDSEALNKYEVLGFMGNVRGTFPSSDALWDIHGPVEKPAHLIVGDDETDVFLKGFDKFRGSNQ